MKVFNKKSSLIKCELKNEIIDMKKLDSERQCYYDCGKDDIVRWILAYRTHVRLYYGESMKKIIILLIFLNSKVFAGKLMVRGI